MLGRGFGAPASLSLAVYAEWFKLSNAGGLDLVGGLTEWDNSADMPEVLACISNLLAQVGANVAQQTRDINDIAGQVFANLGQPYLAQLVAAIAAVQLEA